MCNCAARLLGPRTEQFTLGSIYYYINYGMEVYGNKNLTDAPRDRGLALRSLLQAMQFPVLDCDPMIGDLIHKCWHNKFPNIATLAVATKALLDKRFSGDESQTVQGESDAASLTGNVASKKAFCRELEGHGLFSFLGSHKSC